MCSALRSRMPQNNTIPMPCPGSATGDGKTRQSDSISARRASAAKRVRRREDTMTTSEISISRLSDAEHRVQLRRAVVASTVGTIIEAYDFLLYVQVAARLRQALLPVLRSAGRNAAGLRHLRRRFRLPAGR